jgi:hypothetical protein
MNATMEETFGPVISSYSRAQAIEDGVLVDVSKVLEPCPFKYPVAMTIAAYSAAICAGGKWVNDTSNDNDKTVCGSATLVLPGGQDVKGRLHDVFWMLQDAIKRMNGATDRVSFTVVVDAKGNGSRRNRVELYSVCGPGDTDAPVITIMLQGED